jgi:methylphosphotriester-DNA--protein-cysteine methyltransferase
MAPKIGPRGITIQDVQRVANSGLPKQVSTLDDTFVTPAHQQPKPSSSTQAYNPELLAALMTGQAQPSYGQKYGGFPTRDMLNDAALGYALNIRDIGDYALTKGRQLEAPMFAENQAVQRSATGYDNFAAEIAKGRAARDEKLGGAFRSKPMNAVSDFASAKAEQDRQAAVAKYRSDADNEYNTSYDAQVLPYEQISNAIYDTPISQLARQALITQYGVDPNVARATFTEQTDLDYAKLQREAELAAAGVDFSMSEGEIIYNTQGAEAWQVYQDQKTYEAMYGTPAEQAKAGQDLIDSQNAPIDQEILVEFGIRPKEVTGADEATVRALFMDPEFLSTWIRPSIELLDASNGVTSGADIAGQQGQAYLKANPGDLLIARTLQAIIAEFDFLSR